MNSASLRGLDEMRRLSLAYPEHLASGYRTGEALKDWGVRSARQLVLVGMGGSAIAGDLVGSLIASETDTVPTILRGPDLPLLRPRDSAAIFASYSGNTWETISGYRAASRRGLRRIVVSSGGELSKLAKHDRVPHLVIPPGLPPRAAVGYLVGGILAAVDPLFRVSNSTRIGRIVDALARRKRTIASARGPPKAIAAKVGGRRPFIYTESAFEPVGRRWKTQFEENAKRLASFDTLPELFHNAIVPWDAVRRDEALRAAVLLLEWKGETRRLRTRFDYLDRLLRERRVTAVRILLPFEDRLEAILNGVWLGDLTSLAVAEDAGVDPSQVRAIETMKARLADS